MSQAPTPTHRRSPHEEDHHSQQRPVRSNDSLEMSRVNRAQQMRDQIKTLKNSLPSKAEIVMVRSLNPAEGDRLALYSRQVLKKIAELEEQAQQEIVVQEGTRRETIRERSKKATKNKHEKVVETWMFKEIGAEDRLAALKQKKKHKLAEVAAKREGQIAEAKAMKEAIHQQQKADLVQRSIKWEESVSDMEKRKQEERKEWETQSHAVNLKYMQQVERQKKQLAEKLQRDRERVAAKEQDLQLHSYRAKLNKEEKAQIAKKFSSTTAPNAYVIKEKQEKLLAKLRVHEEKQQQAVQQSIAEREAKVASLSEQREKKFQESQARISEKLRQDQEKVVKLAESIEERRLRHQNYLEEQSVQRERKKQDDHERTMASKAYKEELERQKAMRLAEKVMQRTVRIGESFGVLLDDVPLLLPPPEMGATGNNQRRTDDEDQTDAGADANRPVIAEQPDDDDAPTPASNKLLDRPSKKSKVQKKTSGAKKDTEQQKKNTASNAAIRKAVLTANYPGVTLAAKSSLDFAPALNTVANCPPTCPPAKVTEEDPATKQQEQMPLTVIQRLQILRCESLAEKDAFSLNDPFVTVCPLSAGNTANIPSELHRTATVDEAKQPTWAREIAKIPEGVVKVVIKVWDKDVASNDVVGSVAVQVPMKSFSTSGDDGVCLTLLGGSGNGKRVGQVVVRWLGAEEEASEALPSSAEQSTTPQKDEKQPCAKEEEKADTSAEQQKQPDAETAAPRMKLHILRCVGLTEMDTFGTNDVFVTVHDASDVDGGILYTTPAFGDVKCPVWRDANFDLPLEVRHVTLKVWDQDVASDDFIGSVVSMEIPTECTSAEEQSLELRKADGVTPSGRIFICFENLSAEETTAKEEEPTTEEPVAVEVPTPTASTVEQTPPSTSQSMRSTSSGGRRRSIGLHLLISSGVREGASVKCLSLMAQTLLDERTSSSSRPATSEAQQEPQYSPL